MNSYSRKSQCTGELFFSCWGRRALVCLKQAVYISLGDCDSLGDVQAQIADVCEEAGLDGLTDDLVMSYQRDDGSYATVTRSVPLEAIVEAPTLRLKPAKSKKGRR